MSLQYTDSRVCTCVPPALQSKRLNSFSRVIAVSAQLDDEQRDGERVVENHWM